MTNNTNKLTNGAGFITKSVNNLDNYYTKTSIDSLISTKLERTTASTLPTSGAGNTIYMIPKSTVETNNGYDEYMYLSSKWEKIGDSKVDLSNYYQKTETSSKTEITNALNEKAASNHNHDSAYAAKTHTHEYLPLSGGTVTGGTTFSGGGFGTELIVKRGDATNGAAIQFRGTGEVYGYIGTSSAKQPTWYDAAKTAYTILHAGNSAHTHNYLPSGAGAITASTGVLSVGNANTQYHLVMGTGSTYGWFDVRNSANTMVNAFQMHPDRTVFSKPITASVFRGNVSGTATSAVNADTVDGKHASDFAVAGHNHDSAYAAKSHTHTSSEISDILKATAVADLGWDTTANQQKALAMSKIAYWNGAYSSTSSNLAYCNKGAFGTMATQNTTSYSTATQVNTALAGKSDTGHTHSYVPLGGGTMTGSLKNSSADAGNKAKISSSSIEVVNGKAIYNYIEDKLSYNITITI